LKGVILSKVESVSKDDKHRFAKNVVDSIVLLEGLGIEGDAHCGVTVKHRSRVKKDPSQPNLRQVHVIHAELLDELQQGGFDVHAGTLGENILTAGIDILSLPKGTILKLGDTASIELTGLRNPCSQLDDLQQGLTKAVLSKDENGELVRKSGVMSIVLTSGVVSKGDIIEVLLPDEPFEKLKPV